METIIFFKWLGMTILLVLLVAGGVYWIRVILNKLFPNRTFWFKYKVLRRKFREKDVKKIIEYLDAGKSKVDVKKLILLSPQNKRSRKQVEEVLYIYSEVQKAERRLKNEGYR